MADSRYNDFYTTPRERALEAARQRVTDRCHALRRVPQPDALRQNGGVRWSDSPNPRLLKDQTPGLLQHPGAPSTYLESREIRRGDQRLLAMAGLIERRDRRTLLAIYWLTFSGNRLLFCGRELARPSNNPPSESFMFLGADARNPHLRPFVHTSLWCDPLHRERLAAFDVRDLPEELERFGHPRSDPYPGCLTLEANIFFSHYLIQTG